MTDGLTAKQRKAVQSAAASIRSSCRPLLIGLAGDLACGLGTSGTDPEMCGICLEAPKVPSVPVPEKIMFFRPLPRPVLLDLPRAMDLLLENDPSALALLGLRPEHIFYCSEEGRMLLDHSSLFLSRRAADTFGASAFRIRRLLQKEVLGGHTKRGTLIRNMAELIRIYAAGTDLLLNGRLMTYRERELGLFKDILSGKYSDRHGNPNMEYERLLLDYMGAFRSACAGSRLPAEPDHDRIESLFLEISARIRNKCDLS